MAKSMTVTEAGQKGGLQTSKGHNYEFYQKIGRKGGQRMKELIAKGLEAEKKEVNKDE